MLILRATQSLQPILRPHRTSNMPTISMFYGLLVVMYFSDNKQHHTPHIHVTYGDEEAVYDIATGEVLGGSIPNKKHKLVQAWIELHGEELSADWQLAIRNEPLFRIAPLV